MASTLPTALDFERFFTAAPDRIVVVTPELRVAAVTDAYLTATKKTRAIVGRPLFDVFPDNPETPEEQSSAGVRSHLEHIFQTGQPHRMPMQRYDILRPAEEGGGYETRFWNLAGLPLKDSSGKVEYVLHHVEDVTESERLRHAADIERANLSDFIAKAPAMLCILRGPNHIYEVANEAFLRVFGGPRLLGKPVREALPEAMAQGFVDILDKVYTTGVPFVGNEMPFQFDPGDGSLKSIFVNFVYQPTHDREGKIDGIAAYITDVTDFVHARQQVAQALDAEKLARAEAELANRAKDEFLAVVSHELRTPLTSILGWVQLLRNGSLPAERFAKGLETMERNARAQARLIDDLLDISRIISGKLRLEVGPVEVVDVVEAALESSRPAAEAKGIQLRRIVDSRGPVRGDAARLQQVLWNLLSNAIKFTPRGGKVEVLVQRVESSVEVTISDTGSGLSPDFLPHVFERFRQAHGGPSREYGGMGLGLSIVKHLVELHGGTVAVRSDGLGKGSAFRVRLPLAVLRSAQPGAEPDVADLPEASVAPYECPPVLAGLHILVVDDEVDTGELLRTLLERCHVRVTTATSARDALAALGRALPDLILSDVGMAGEDGYGFMRKVRALPPERGGKIPSVALTAYSRSEDRKRALLAGFNMHVAKPIDPGELVVVLASLVQRS